MSNIYFLLFVLMCSSLGTGELSDAHPRPVLSVQAVEEEVRVMPGGTAIFRCVVQNLGTRKMVWAYNSGESSDGRFEYFISVMDVLFTSDTRFRVELNRGPDDLMYTTLILRDAKMSDSGVYVCFASSHNSANSEARVHLHVTGGDGE
ncbi:uncharacterized protein LOC101852547 [Aplysia californica]|uniref:Uncharacterized protein LOC101852547 n=1 Tax=Aplysia californica TaxID=6500 RepID=A0ABM1A1D7_APLCA|nr:uncharacterized protein LOC101852547 [Aplysia californica]